MGTCQPSFSSDGEAVESNFSRKTYRTPYQPSMEKQYSFDKQKACTVSIIEEDNFTDTYAESFTFDTVQRNKDGWKMFYTNEPSLNSNITDSVEGHKLSLRKHAYTISTPFRAHQQEND